MAERRRSFDDWARGIMAIIVIAILVWFWVSCGHFLHGIPSERFTPHGLAAKMCDSLPDHRDPDLIKYGDTWYSADCLAKYGQ